MSKKKSTKKTSSKANKHQRILDELNISYNMELETVINYLANSVWLDGIRAKHIKDSIGIKTMRVVGDPQTKIRRVAISPGYSSLQGALRAMPNNDLYIVGEAREWEGVEYAFDAMTAGMATPASSSSSYTENSLMP